MILWFCKGFYMEENSQPAIEKMYTTHEVATMFHRTPFTIRRWIHDEQIATSKIKGRIYISEASIRKFLDNLKHPKAEVGKPAPEIVKEKEVQHF